MTAPKFILPFPNILSISHFIRTGVTNFLTNYGDMYKDYNIEKKERVYRYSRYCIEYIIIVVRGLASFFELD